MAAKRILEQHVLGPGKQSILTLQFLDATALREHLHNGLRPKGFHVEHQPWLVQLAQVLLHGVSCALVPMGLALHHPYHRFLVFQLQDHPPSHQHRDVRHRGSHQALREHVPLQFQGVLGVAQIHQPHDEISAVVLAGGSAGLAGSQRVVLLRKDPQEKEGDENGVGQRGGPSHCVHVPHQGVGLVAEQRGEDFPEGALAQILTTSVGMVAAQNEGAGGSPTHESDRQRLQAQHDAIGPREELQHRAERQQQQRRQRLHQRRPGAGN
mmetsp:Transcript_40665/g.96999  ORF Transcript_40665/g.96999 Transcript_40665/m.96999 type:complete len:267 (-) Transcript_40665:282-1082(-)